MATLIKRYSNRKLYNTETSRYITLKGISELIDQGVSVQVIDNETGEDITSVALSQILVDSERSNSSVPGSLLSQLMGRGGDAIYGALKQGVTDASEGLEELQERVKRAIGNEAGEDRRRLGEWIAFSGPDFEQKIQGAVQRVFEVLDLPRHSDIERLNKNLERVAAAIAKQESDDSTATDSDSPDENAPRGAA